jgi:hypothetical protein
MPLGEFGEVSFAAMTGQVNVWDQITLSNGASFGTIRQTFTEEAEVPEPPSFVLISCALFCLVSAVARGQARNPPDVNQVQIYRDPERITAYGDADFVACRLLSRGRPRVPSRATDRTPH